MKQTYDIGLVGLGVMGRNVLLNSAEKGFSALGYDTDPEKVRQLRDSAGPLAVDAVGLPELFVQHLKHPRTILILVPAGPAIDSVLATLLPHLETGDRLVDGGNSFFRDTERREKEISPRGIHFFGMGISGGEEGARHGPSLMPGGDRAAYDSMRGWLEAMSAKVSGEPCVTYIGPRGAGHYVKMVHNAIEYGWMQLISEAVDLMRRGLGLDWNAIADQFETWNAQELNAFLIEISAAIPRVKDSQTGRPLVEMISDIARQKGTGKWATDEAKILHVAVPTIDMAVTWRDLSSWTDQRHRLHDRWGSSVRLLESAAESGSRSRALGEVREALYAGMLTTMAQGMALLREASQAYEYSLSLDAIARIWRGGCIIRASMLDAIAQAYRRQPDLPNLLADPMIGKQVQQRETALRSFCRMSFDGGLAAPGFSASLSYWDALRDLELPMNFVQAQRDFFGAHGYERRDRPGVFHTDWKSR